jgi:hypothetical protein
MARLGWGGPPVPIFAMVLHMADNRVDPSGNTEAFRAFTENASPEPPPASRRRLMVGGIAVAVLLVALFVWLATQ